MVTGVLARVDLAERTVREIQELEPLEGVTLVLRGPGGRQTELASGVQKALLDALALIAAEGEVVIGRVPEELTSTVAADMLGVSRPTLLRWSREGVIPSFKVGSHTRFRRKDVITFRAARERERRQAFEELRALDLDDGFGLFGD